MATLINYKNNLAELLKLHNKWTHTGGLEGVRANLSGADLRGLDLHEVELRGAILCKADLTEANLLGAYLLGANLTRTDFEGADLAAADLEGADLTEANLLGANLYYTYLEQTNLDSIKGVEILTFRGTKHFAYYCNGLLKIGCMVENLNTWLDIYEVCGEDNNYTAWEIRQYKRFIDKCIEFEAKQGGGL